jgi:ABC-type nitrate/sulfonate/bicarbonate transport system substrate-binding protein
VHRRLADLGARVWIDQNGGGSSSVKFTDLVSRFAAVIHDTAVWANKNPQQSGDILAKCDKIEPAVIAAMARNHYAEQINPALMQPLIDAAAKYSGSKRFRHRISCTNQAEIFLNVLRAGFSSASGVMDMLCPCLPNRIALEPLSCFSA